MSGGTKLSRMTINLCFNELECMCVCWCVDSPLSCKSELHVRFIRMLSVSWITPHIPMTQCFLCFSIGLVEESVDWVHVQALCTYAIGLVIHGSNRACCPTWQPCIDGCHLSLCFNDCKMNSTCPKPFNLFVNTGNIARPPHTIHILNIHSYILFSGAVPEKTSVWCIRVGHGINVING